MARLRNQLGWPYTDRSVNFEIKCLGHKTLAQERRDPLPGPRPLKLFEDRLNVEPRPRHNRCWTHWSVSL